MQSEQDQTDGYRTAVFPRPVSATEIFIIVLNNDRLGVRAGAVNLKTVGETLLPGMTRQVVGL